MNQVRQCGWGAGAAIVLAAMIGAQAFAADLAPQSAAIYRGIALAPPAPSAKAGNSKTKGTPFRSRPEAARGQIASADWQWTGPSLYAGAARADLQTAIECSGYPESMGELLERAMHGCTQGLFASSSLSGRYFNARNSDNDDSPGAYAAPAGLWSKAALPSVPWELAAEIQASATPLYRLLLGCAWLLLGYSGYLAALTLFQRRFVFNPTHASGPAAQLAHTHEITSVRMPLRNNKSIRGWFLRPRQGRAPYPAIIYYGGRSEEVSWLRGAVQWFPRHALLAVNYRGYGESEGDPSERGLFEDGLAQFDWLAAQPGVDPKAIVLVGRSLGTGVASYVAAKRPAERVVLITPYDSLLAVARRRFRFTPLSLLLRHKFISVDYARTNMQPCLALLAEQDDVVPEVHTQRLMAAWAGAKKLVRIPRTTHLDIPYQAATLTAVATWLGYASVPPGPLSLIGPAS